MPEERMSCHSCGNAILSSDAFCSRCGTGVREAGLDAGAERRTLVRDVMPTADRRHCGSCNAPLFPGDAYCAACGSTQSPEGGDPGREESVVRFRSRVEEASRGRYQILREIGRGGMGAVFLADDTEFDRKVAIKILSGGTSDPATLRRFEREARTVAQLRHDAIVRVHDVGGVGDLHYFVMDYVEGVSLQRFLQSEGPLPIAMVEAILYRVGVGLAHAHAQANPVVHRDVKPSNILVDTEGQVTIMDFGVAKVGQESAGLTRTGMIVGTPEYISPEQVRSAPVSPATDQYALGAVAFAMLTGRPPFAGSFYEVLIAHQKEPIPDVREARPEVPPPLAEAVERMLEKDPAARWPGIPEILRALELRPLSPYDPTAMEMARLSRTLVQRADAPAGERGGGGVDVRASSDRLRITLPRDTIEVGDSLTLRVGLDTGDGRVEPVDDVSWSSEPPHVVRIDGDTGELVAVAPGQARLTAKSTGVDGSAEITVSPPEVVQVEVEPESLTLPVGRTARLQAQTLSRSGRPLDHARTWASSDPTILSVSEAGEVRALREGAASVVLYCDSAWTAVAVRVEEAPAVAPPGGPAETTADPVDAADVPPSVTPIPGTARTRTPDPSPSPAGARTQDPAEPGTASSPPERGVVSRPRHRKAGRRGGRAVPAAAGLGLLVVLGGGGWWLVSGGDDVPPPAVEADPRPATQAAAPSPVDPPGAAADGGAAPPPGTPPPAWAEVQLRGAAGAEAAADPLVLTAGGGATLTGVLVDSAGDPVDGPAPEWISDDPAVVQVRDGAVLARGEGTTRIRARVGDREASVAVRVQADRPPPPAWSGLELREGAGGGTVAGPMVLTAGQAERLRGVPVDDRGTPVEGPRPRWSSDDVGVARVLDGTVRAVAPGTTRIRARAGDVEAALEVIVRAATPPEGEPDPDEDPLPPADGVLIIQLTGGPWANVRVDGRVLGEYQTRYELSPLSAGSHRVQLEGNTAAEPVDTTIIIQPGDTVIWRRRLGGGSHP
jgi:serine/threonine-protein kinase